MATTLQQLVVERAAYFASPEGQVLLERSILCLSPTVMVLAEYAATSTDDDGWVCLARAGNLVRKRAADDFESIKKERGCTLKGLLISTDAFELADQVTSNGRRAVYRLRRDGRGSVTFY